MTTILHACRKYAVRVEHCFWVLSDRRADKKITTGGFVMCSLVSLWRVDCVRRRLCDELTGSRFNTVCITQYQIQQQQRFEMTASITCPIKQASQSDTIHWHTARAGQSSNYFTNDKIGIMTCHINAILHSHATTYTWLSQLLLWWWWLMMKSTKWFFNLWQSSITLIKPHSYFS